MLSNRFRFKLVLTATFNIWTLNWLLCVALFAFFSRPLSPSLALSLWPSHTMPFDHAASVSSFFDVNCVCMLCSAVNLNLMHLCVACSFSVCSFRSFGTFFFLMLLSWVLLVGSVGLSFVRSIFRATCGISAYSHLHKYMYLCTQNPF